MKERVRCFVYRIFQVQSFEAVADILERAGNTSAAAYVRHDIHSDIKRCMRDVIKVHGYAWRYIVDLL